MLQNVDIIRKCVAAGTALAAALLSMPALPTAAEDPLALRISKTELGINDVHEDRVVSVEVRIDGNENGFIASEFGIAYDSRLSLQNIRCECDAANSFSYSSAASSHTIWFSAANAEPESGAAQTHEKLFTLEFVLPEDYALGDVYLLGYEWMGVDGEEAFWYTDTETNEITNLMTYSSAGSISIPDENSPKLSKSSIELNQGATHTLTVQNSDEAGVWFSDNEAVATVADGVVTAVSAGSCNISVFLAGSNALLTCEVNVRSDFRYSMFDSETVTITSPSQKVTLEYPGAVGSIQWISTNMSVVMVEDGVLTPVADGHAQIIASNNGIAKMKTVIVKLENEPETPPSEELTTESQPELACGDLTGDGTVDIVDVIAINKYLLGSVSLDDAQKACADVFHDGVLDTTDGLTLLKFVVEMIPELPVEA